MPKEVNARGSNNLRKIRLRAVSWLLRLEQNELSTRQHMRYLSWLQRSPLHRREMHCVLRLRLALSDEAVWERANQSEPRIRYH